MGAEHSFQQRLWDIATSAASLKPVVLPMPLDGLWVPAKAQGKVNRYSLNQDWQRVANWLLDVAQDRSKQKNEAITRARHLHAVQREWGHWCSGPGGKSEFGTASHRQLYYAGMAGELWASHLIGADELVNDVTLAWRLQTALAARCHYQDPSTGFTALYPGARDGKPDAPMAINRAMDEVDAALLRGWENPPRTPKNPAYSACIPLLKRAFAAGVDPKSLIGDDGDLERIPARFGWHLVGGAPGDYYAWFDSLDSHGSVYDGLHGAGRVGGETLLAWTKDSAAEAGERIREAI